jgi:hypothetical protein
MLFKTIIPFVFLAQFAIAAPVSDTSLEKREPGCVYICDQVNFAGNCWKTCPGSSCINLDTVIRSFGPDAGDHASCELYSNTDCEQGLVDDVSRVLPISYPGTTDVYAATGFVPGSYTCYAPS